MYMDETFRLKVGLAEMLKGGVIMDVTNAEQAVIAEKAGATAVMALERVPADIRKEGGVARMAPIAKIREIMHQVSIPVMAKARIGHFMEARILEALAVDYIDESEVLTPADEEHHIDKRGFKVPFVCGARNLGEALRRIAEGAAMIRTKGEAGSGNIVEAVRHIRTIVKEMKQLTVLGHEELVAESKKHQAPLELVEYVAEHGRLPVPNFSAGGIATPADAALVMQLGAEAVFVGSGIFKSSDPEARARAIVKAATYYNDPAKLLEASEELGAAHVRPRYREIARIGIAANARLVVGAKRVGVLALQGDFEAHERALKRAGAEAVEVRSASDLESVGGLVIPGGESTTMMKLLEEEKLLDPLREFGREHPIFGTCAGAILLATDVANPPQASLGLMDIEVERNAYGRQLDSRIARLHPEGIEGELEAVFIRAPIIRHVGKNARVLASYQGDPVLVEQGRHLAATFHPELTDDSRVHLMFLRKIP